MAEPPARHLVRQSRSPPPGPPPPDARWQAPRPVLLVGVCARRVGKMNMCLEERGAASSVPGARRQLLAGLALLLLACPLFAGEASDRSAVEAVVRRFYTAY